MASRMDGWMYLMVWLVCVVDVTIVGRCNRCIVEIYGLVCFVVCEMIKAPIKVLIVSW